VPAPYILDTNAYGLFFQHPKNAAYFRLINKLKVGAEISFYISEITSMEIHSVLGKWRRGRPFQRQPCGREIILESRTEICSNTWTTIEIKKLKFKVYRALRKMISDIERQRGDIQATILSLDDVSTKKAQQLLQKNADRYAFVSHDALIAATLSIARDVSGLDLTLVTSDKGLKAVLKEESLPFYDPLKE
jgi:hypothetical protein